uniref:Ribosomal protein S11 n=1 Tax=Navicula veneta TaxID=138539 RepID=A0A8F0WGJ2_9STRA|nr:ribosomal protein S11 [Navicula veneta]QWM93646.1 ribosomal protein S11 [Navicula veneta]
MKNNINRKENILLSNFSLKKKSLYFKKTNNSIVKLKNLLNEKQNHKKFNSLITTSKSFYNSKKLGSVVIFTINFSFSPVNTFLYITDALGNLKFRYSAGLVEFKGKQKKNRFQVLNRFFRELKKLKITVLKNKPIALHLKNVGSYKYLIIKNIKKKFFVRLVKSYQTYPFNGCRKKKQLRKR